jgi:hypothetical protein
MSIPLLTTKLYIPSPRPNLVPRPKLINRISEGISQTLVLICAPAGFGKTTLLSDWACQAGLHIAFIFWGLWLLPLGYLVFKSGFIPKILGIMLIIAGFGYLFEVVTFFLLPDLDITIRMFTFGGEVFLALWLLIMGVNADKWEERALGAAAQSCTE